MKKVWVLLGLSLLGCSPNSTVGFDPVDAGPDVSVDAGDPCSGFKCGMVTDDAGEQVNCGNCEKWSWTQCSDNLKPGVCGSECVKSVKPVACNLMLMGNCLKPGQLDEFVYACKDPKVVDEDNCMLWYVNPKPEPVYESGYFWCCLPKDFDAGSLIADPSCELQPPPPGPPPTGPGLRQ